MPRVLIVADVDLRQVHAGAGLRGLPAVDQPGAAILQGAVAAQGRSRYRLWTALLHAINADGKDMTE